MDGQRGDRLWRLVAARAGRRHDVGWAGVVCEVAAEQVDVDAAAISVHAASRAQELVATTGDWARRLEELQYTLGEGPGGQAFRTGGPVLVADLATGGDPWPVFADAATATGVGAVFAFPLRGGASRFGALTLYRRHPGPLAAAGLADATVLADLAAAALFNDANGVDVDTAPWAQEDSSGHYADVSMATGMLAAQLRISVEEALLRLRAHAYSHDLPLLDIARAVLHHGLRLDSAGD